MEAGAEHPTTLGVMLQEVLSSPAVLSHPDYSYAAASLLGALHSSDDGHMRQHLEQLILELPGKIKLHNDETRDPVPDRVTHAQNRLLGVLSEANIQLESVKQLWRERAASDALFLNQKRSRAEVKWHTVSDEEAIQQSGVNLKDASNQKTFDLRQSLQRFISGDNGKIEQSALEPQWELMLKAYRMFQRYRKTHPKMANDLWGYVVGACEKFAERANWPRNDVRWKTARSILLLAAKDPDPIATASATENDDAWPSWGWPAPRIDAARGLPLTVFRLGKIDREISSSLRNLCVDSSHPVRFNLADRLAVLERPAADVMWELIDTIISREQKFSVLEAVLLSLDRVQSRSRDKARARIWAITDQARANASARNHIHETLAHVHLFYFLRTGDHQAKQFIDELIQNCENEPQNHSLLAQLHTCRAGGWLTAGDAVNRNADADAIRARTWTFFSDLLTASQTKLQTYRDEMRQIYELGKIETDAVKALQAKLDRVAHLVDGIAMQLYFASGAFAEKRSEKDDALTMPQLRRFWNETAPLFARLAAEPHPHTAHQVVQTMAHLLPCAPREVFSLAAKSIQCSAAAGFQHESLAVPEVVKLIQRALADHRDIFQSGVGQTAEYLDALLGVLDLFVEAGWPEARQLTHRLEEIYR